MEICLMIFLCDDVLQSDEYLFCGKTIFLIEMLKDILESDTFVSKI